MDWVIREGFSECKDGGKVWCGVISDGVSGCHFGWDLGRGVFSDGALVCLVGGDIGRSLYISNHSYAHVRLDFFSFLHFLSTTLRLS